MEGRVNTMGTERPGGSRALAECGKWANVRVSGKLGAALGEDSTAAHRGGRPGLGSPQGGRAYLALAGVAGVRRGQLRPQKTLCAVTQGLCMDKNAMWRAEGGAADVSLSDLTFSHYPQTSGARGTPMSIGSGRINPLSLWFSKGKFGLSKRKFAKLLGVGAGN